MEGTYRRIGPFSTDGLEGPRVGGFRCAGGAGCVGGNSALCLEHSIINIYRGSGKWTDIVATDPEDGSNGFRRGCLRRIE